MKGYLGLDVADKVEVKLFRTDFRHGYVDFENPTGEGDEEEQRSQEQEHHDGAQKGRRTWTETRRKKPPLKKKVDHLAEKRGKRK